MGCSMLTVKRKGGRTFRALLRRRGAQPLSAVERPWVPLLQEPLRVGTGRQEVSVDALGPRRHNHSISLGWRSPGPPGRSEALNGAPSTAKRRMVCTGSSASSQTIREARASNTTNHSKTVHLVSLAVSLGHWVLLHRFVVVVVVAFFG